MNTPSLPTSAVTPFRPSVRGRTLDDVLMVLERVGKPNVGKLTGGWMCGVELATVAVGMSSTIRSEFGMATPIAAALQCEERVLAALKGAGA